MGWCHGSWRTPGTPGSLLAEALSRSKSDEVVLALINTLEMSKARRYQYEWSFNMVTPDMTLPAFLHLFEAIVSRNRAACVGMAMLQHCPEDPASLSTSRTLAHTALKSRAPALLSITLVRRFIEAFDLSANYFSACSSCSEDFKDCSRRDPGLYFDLSLDNADSTFAAVLERRAHVPPGLLVELQLEDLLHIALAEKAPDEAVLMLLAAFPACILTLSSSPQSPHYGGNAMHCAVKYNASITVINAMIAACPASVFQPTNDGPGKRNFGAPGGYMSHYARHVANSGARNVHAGLQTPLHVFANLVRVHSNENGKRFTEDSYNAATDKFQNMNAVCYALHAAGASLATLNGLNQTPLEHACGDFKSEKRHHVTATFGEMLQYEREPNDLEHFRDWTATSHAWCVPSAKLTALTVLLVGSCCERDLWPELPVEIWHYILNFIPRYRLRQGHCTDDEEEYAGATYKQLLRDGRRRGLHGWSAPQQTLPSAAPAQLIAANITANSAAIGAADAVGAAYRTYASASAALGGGGEPGIATNDMPNSPELATLRYAALAQHQILGQWGC